MSSELEVLRQQISELEAELKIKNDELEAWRQRATLNEEKIDELKARSANLEVKNFDLKNKVAKLEQEHKSTVEDLKRKDTEFESRLVKMEQGSPTVGERSRGALLIPRHAKLLKGKRKTLMVRFRVSGKRNKRFESSAQDSTSNHRMISENSGRIVETVTKSHDHIEPKVGNSLK